MDENTVDELTPQETIEEEETGATPEEAHREGEFDALSAKLDEIITKLDSVSSAIAEVTSVANAVSVDNGAVFNDGEAEEANVLDEDVTVADTVEDARERDYTIER